ncbi:MAG: tRNA lysidine(34) synthetase TilS [Brevinematia bacterium]
MKERFIEKVRNTITKYNLLSMGDKVLVALSGGPDSVALLDVLLELKEEFSLEIKAFHLNHQLRDTAKRDEEFCIEFCKKKGVEIFVAREDIRSFSKKNKLSLEEAGRIVRYNLLKKELRRNNFNKIATAHHMDDNIETLFLRMFKGTSIEGLKVMRPKVGRIIRPLLECSRREIIDYLESKELDFVTDETNFDIAYERNYIRLEVLPKIEKKFPYYREHLRNLINDFQSVYRFLSSFTKKYLDSVVVFESDKAIVDLSKLLGVNKFIILEVIKKVFRKLGFSPSRKVLNAILPKLYEKEGNKNILPTKRFSVFREYDKLVITIKRSRQNFFKEFEVGGIKFEILVSETFSFEVLENTFDTFDNIKEDARKGILYLDLSNARKVVFRNREAGDFIVSKGIRKKVKDILIDDKVPFSLREKLIIVEIDGEVAGIFYNKIRVSDKFLVTKSSKKILKIEFTLFPQ